MMITNTFAPLTTVGLLGMLALGGCKEAAKGPGTASPSPAPASAPAPAAAPELTLSAEESAAFQPMLADYEALRALLANDKLEGLAAAAAGLGGKAAELGSRVPEAAKPRLDRLAASARALEKASAESIKAARLAFGELSREVVGLLAAAPALRQGRHVFECGMADGYQKWVQPGEELENPYMGQAMLACGSTTDWQ